MKLCKLYIILLWKKFHCPAWSSSEGQGQYGDKDVEEINKGIKDNNTNNKD